MTDVPSVLCLIPARGGSKTIPRKNLRIVGGKPLIAYSIETASASRTIGRTIVSTDDREIAEVARRFGAEVPFVRPVEISGDAATDLEAFEHALRWLRERETYVPDICVHLRPTHPIRRVDEVDRVVELLAASPQIDSVRSVAPASETPFKMWFRSPDGLLSPATVGPIPEPYNLPRQRLPQAYVQNAAIDAVWTRVITEMRS
ncbi:MAG: cytidylyltransferase domain-containing protein, partial [Vicinamibacterales bacterium]